MSSGFQFVGGVYDVPLVYSVSSRGNWVIVPPDDGDADADDDADVEGDADVDADELLLLDDELLQALAVASASTATAAVPYFVARHRRPVVLFVGLTCSYLLTSKSSDNPVQVTAGSRRRSRAGWLANRFQDDPCAPGCLSVLGSVAPWRVRPAAAVEQVGYTG